MSNFQQGVQKQASGRQPRRAAFWKAQPMHLYVSIYKSRTTPDHGVRRGFSNTPLRLNTHTREDHRKWLNAAI